MCSVGANEWINWRWIRCAAVLHRRLLEVTVDRLVGRRQEALAGKALVGRLPANGRIAIFDLGVAIRIAGRRGVGPAGNDLARIVHSVPRTAALSKLTLVRGNVFALVGRREAARESSFKPRVCRFLECDAHDQSQNVCSIVVSRQSAIGRLVRERASTQRTRTTAILVLGAIARDRFGGIEITQGRTRGPPFGRIRCASALIRTS